MSLDILYASIIKKIDTIGGFCLVPTAKVDYIKYFPVDASKIGVNTDSITGYVAAVKLAKG
jgi:hypothetical protein